MGTIPSKRRKSKTRRIPSQLTIDAVNLGGLCVIALLAFPPGADPEPKQDEPVPAKTPSAFQTQFTTHASPAGVRAVACGLRAALASRPVDVRVDGVYCAVPSANAHAMDVAIRGTDVELRLRVPEGTTPEELSTLDQGLHDIQVELARRVALLPQAVVTAPPIWTRPPDVKKGTKRSTRWWIVTGVLAGATGLASVIGGSVVAAGGQQNNASLKNTGETILEVLVAPAAVATAITLTIAIILSAQGN